MTIDHASAAWGYGGTPSSATIAGQQGGYRTGRLFPVAPSEAGGSATIRPYVVPWTPAADSFGVAFPAGIVGVTTDLVLPSPLGATINSDYESQWDGFLASLIPVPAVLPVGYTASLQTDWRSLTAQLYRLRTASGYTDKTWLPTSSPNGIETAFDSIDPLPFNGGFTSPSRKNITVASTGYRKLQFKVVTAGLWLAMPAYGTAPFTINHNANGTNPGNTSADGSVPGTAGDTIDFSGSVSDSDFSDPDGNFRWETGWIDCGEILPTLGTLTYFQFAWDATGFAFALSPGFYFYFRLSPRCDVPYPISVAGQGDLIAPGGYP
jgi:hypothetical protein